MHGRPQIRARGGTCPPPDEKCRSIFVTYYILSFNKYFHTKILHKMKLRNLNFTKNCGIEYLENYSLYINSGHCVLTPPPGKISVGMTVIAHYNGIFKPVTY